jgi:hypothetical protein
LEGILAKGGLVNFSKEVYESKMLKD